MITKAGLMMALAGLLGEGCEVGLYTNELEREDANLSDLKEAKNYRRQPIAGRAWRVDEEKGYFVGPKVTFNFDGGAGVIVGYFVVAGGALIAYAPLPHPVPVSTNEDVIWVRPRMRARNVGQALELGRRVRAAA